MNAFATLRKSRTIDVQSAFSDACFRWRLATRNWPREGLDAQETIALLKYRSGVVGRDVLDIGIGTGRTARVLASLARHYFAIDYSPPVVAELRRTMPDVEVHPDDMRDLGRWEDGTLDFVFGPNNVLDIVSHTDREKTLAEFHRVLRTDGLLVFSSHNRCYVRAKDGPSLRRSRNPVTFALHVARYLASLTAHVRMKPLRRFEPDYALIDDCGPDHALLHYHVDRTAQERQLRRIGFDLVEVLDKTGDSVPRGVLAPMRSTLL
jgi:SAM-dependent methyltransferase